MTEQQIQALDRYERELRPNLPSLDRTIEIPPYPLAVRRQQMRDMFKFSGWSDEKIFAAAIIYLLTLGYDSEEEERCEAQIRADQKEAEKRWRQTHEQAK